MEEILSSLGIDIDETKLGRAGLLIWKKAKHRHLVFTIYPSGRVEINGSLHKYWTNGENYSDFSFVQLCECISDLCQRFQIPLTAEVQNLEFGVNITTLFNPFEFCEHVVSYWDGKKLFREMDEEAPVIGFECERTEYKIKIYDKGRQYKKLFNRLHFEVAVNRMRGIEEVGINTLTDLTDRGKIEKLGLFLNEMFERLIISDQVNTSELSAKDLQIYNRGTNPNVWKKMKRWERVRFKPAFKRVIDVYGKNKWIVPTAKMIDEKWRMLLVINSQTANVLAGGREGSTGSKVANDLPDILNRVEKTDCKRSLHYGKMGERSDSAQLQRFKNGFGGDIFGLKKERKPCRNKGPPNEEMNKERRVLNECHCIASVNFILQGGKPVAKFVQIIE